LYWAKIDSGGVVTEINESDNVTSAGLVVIQGNGLYVPVVNR
jgi:hypothetical protein